LEIDVSWMRALVYALLCGVWLVCDEVPGELVIFGSRVWWMDEFDALDHGHFVVDEVRGLSQYRIRCSN
jgi:hypothetical protein